MKAIVSAQYGSPDVMQLQEVATPSPKPGEVLVKIHAASVNAADWHFLRGSPWLMRLKFGLLRPKLTILGSDVAGVVEAVGTGVTAFRPGDAVFGDVFASGLGAFAEYVCAREDALVLKPPSLSFEDAAAVPLAAVTALQGLRKGGVAAGQQVLIHGASGGVGTYAVQIAKAIGAEVTAVCSTGNVEMVRSIGADHIVDYTKEDFTKGGQQYDLILAANGSRSIWVYRRALRPHGRYVLTGGAGGQLVQVLLLGPWISLAGSRKMQSVMAVPDQKDLASITELLVAGKLRPVIDRRYPLSEVADAVRYVEAGHARGKVVIQVR